MLRQGVLNLKGKSQSGCHAVKVENEAAMGAMGSQSRKALS